MHRHAEHPRRNEPRGGAWQCQRDGDHENVQDQGSDRRNDQRIARHGIERSNSGAHDQLKRQSEIEQLLLGDAPRTGGEKRSHASDQEKRGDPSLERSFAGESGKTAPDECQRRGHHNGERSEARWYRGQGNRSEWSGRFHEKCSLELDEVELPIGKCPSLPKEEEVTGLVADHTFLDHITPQGHPERTKRMQVLLDWAKQWENDPRVVRIQPRAASREEIEAVHDSEHFEAMAETAGKAASMVDSDTYTSPLSFETARLAAGSCIEIVDAVLDGRIRNGIALVRPPGHHAESHRAMGFCLFNNIAIAAAHARRRGIDRVLIVDWDVHHGNGTQQIFEEDPSVYFISLHQYPFYPGTGAATEVGRGDGRGFTLNIPMPAGCNDEDYLVRFRERVVVIGKEFAPDLVLVSAGFDAHANDPLGGMRVTTQGFARMADELLGLARDTCAGKIVAVLEGGYDLGALRDSTGVVMSRFLEEASRPHASRTPS